MPKKSKPGPNIRGWVQERIIFLALIIFLVGASAYIAAGKLFSPDSIWLHPVKEFSLLLSLIGVVSVGYEVFLRELTFREYKQALQEIVNPDGVRLGIKRVFKNRSELGQSVSFEELFGKTNHEIFIGGTSLLSISTSSRELLKEKVLAGVTVRLLLMNPESPVVELITKQGGGKPTLLNEIKTSLLLLQKVYYEIDTEPGYPHRGKLIVHTYDTIPSHSFISLDRNEPHGLIIADIGPYLGRNTARPSMLVTKKKHGIYDYWLEMSDIMWVDSRPVDFKSSEPWETRTKTLVFTSGPNTEYHDPETDTWRPAAICQMDKNWKSIKGSQWVWIRDSVTLEEAKTGSQNKFRLKFHLPARRERPVIRADLLVRSDDTCHITVNDVGLKQEYGGADYPDAFLVDIDKFIRAGENVIYFEVINFAKPDAQSPEDNPTGLVFRLHIDYNE